MPIRNKGLGSKIGFVRICRGEWLMRNQIASKIGITTGITTGITMKFVFIAIVLAIAVGSEAFAAGKKATGKAAVRERIISREGSSKKGSKTKINFDDENISGEGKGPNGSMLKSTKASKDFDMVQIRTDWRQHMVESAGSLDAGNSR